MVIVIQCKDDVGIVAALSGVLASKNLNIVSMREHVDIAESRFYMRLQIEKTSNENLLESDLKAVLPEDAIININPVPYKKIVILVTKEYHCLSDILIRNHFGTLGASVECVIGNHATLADICQRFNIPFKFVSHEQKTKADFEREIADHIKKFDPDFIVLAKFMRILSPSFVSEFPTRLINIHHSFLPAFVGANPYKQAFERGVKLIGATAHFVTNDLDEGPIIAQQIIPVNHTYNAADMMKAGKEVETSVLAKALRLVFEDRVFVYKNKTVVFE